MKRGTATSSFGAKSRINHDSSKFYNSKLYTDALIKGMDVVEDNELPVKFLDKIIFSSSEKMEGVPSNSIHLMVTSPPYNVSKDYDDDLSLNEYLGLLKNVFRETYRVLVNGGRACVNLANIGRKPYIPLTDFVSKMMIDIGFNMRGEIIWNKGSSAGTSMAWGSYLSASNPVLRDVHEYILVFSKGEYGRKNIKKENSITKEQFLEWTKSVWSMNTESARRVGHPAPFPEELPYRLIQLYSFKNDIILDPFMGSGTTAISALKSERKYLGFEINKEYVNIAESRIKAYKDQLKLKF